ETGRITAYPFRKTSAGIKAKFELPPCGSLLLFLPKEPREEYFRKSQTTVVIPPQGETQVSRLADNVLTLDYVDVTAAGETKKNIYFYKASQFVFAKNGMARNPWDSAVQFRDELIKTKFPAQSGFEATYHFTINRRLPSRLHIVIERPDLYSITCNGKTVSSIKERWWLDKSFGRIEITGAAKVGRNAVTIKASPMTIYHELEAAYLLGDFALKATESGFVVEPESDPALGLGGWEKQGHHFYAGDVSYSQRFNVGRRVGRYSVELPRWYGSVAEVRVNDTSAGFMVSQPWKLDVTRWIKNGRNDISVIVTGTLKNTLGPHHAGQILGAAWPNMFQRAPETGPPPGEKYHTISYGLFEAFVLKQTSE
ncbi:MAG: hypothetical protein JSW47_20020, partial [Phycisphaerales bacterium]